MDGKVTKIQAAISYIEAERKLIDLQIQLLRRESERLFTTLTKLEKIKEDKFLN